VSDREAHLAFLQENKVALMTGSTDAYAQHGRGLWLLDSRHSNDEQTQAAYITDLDGLPDDDWRERLQGMVASYDPATQAVVHLWDEDGSQHAYIVGRQETTDEVHARPHQLTGSGKSHNRVPSRTVTMPANKEAAVDRLKALEGDHSNEANWERSAIIHAFTKEDDND
jgi:hypothetical protein